MNDSAAEVDRIRREYARREREIDADFYALHRPANLFLRHGQERALLFGLKSADLLPLAGRRILEVGCGRGQWFESFLHFGADLQDLAGIDLDETRCAEARQRFIGADVQVGDAAHLPWSDATFDVVFQSTVFTSILDDALQHAVADEMRRVLRPGGAIVWYDFRFNNPRNPNVRGVGKSAMARLFPGCSVSTRRVTLAPPLARRIVPWSWTLASLLEAVALFNTHYLAIIRPVEQTRR